MRLCLDFKTTIEKTPATLIKKPFVLFFCSKWGEFPVLYLANHIAVKKDVICKTYDISKKDISVFINDTLDKGFFSEPGLNILKGLESLRKKESEKMIDYLKSSPQDTFIVYIPSAKYGFFKKFLKEFFNISLFDDNLSWLYKKYINGLFEDICGWSDSEITQCVYENVRGKELDKLKTQLEKVALYFATDGWEDTPWKDHVSTALDLDSFKDFISTLRLLELMLSGGFDDAMVEFYRLKENMPVNIINSTLISHLIRLIAITSLYRGNEDVKSVFDMIKSTGPMRYSDFNIFIRKLKKVLPYSGPELNEQLLKKLNRHNIGTFKYFCDTVSIDRANKLLYTMLKNDCRLKNGEVLSAGDAFLITMKEVL